MTMNCPKCGFKNEPKSLFCGGCGNPISDSSKSEKIIKMENKLNATQRFNEKLMEDMAKSKKRSARFTLFVGVAFAVFLVFYYVYFSAFGYVKHRIENSGTLSAQISFLAISSFFITRAIWYLVEKVFKIGPPF